MRFDNIYLTNGNTYVLNGRVIWPVLRNALCSPWFLHCLQQKCEIKSNFFRSFSLHSQIICMWRKQLWVFTAECCTRKCLPCKNNQNKHHSLALKPNVWRVKRRLRSGKGGRNKLVVFPCGNSTWHKGERESQKIKREMCLRSISVLLITVRGWVDFFYLFLLSHSLSLSL